MIINCYMADWGLWRMVQLITGVELECLHTCIIEEQTTKD